MLNLAVGLRPPWLDNHSVTSKRRSRQPTSFALAKLSHFRRQARFYSIAAVCQYIPPQCAVQVPVLTRDQKVATAMRIGDLTRVSKINCYACSMRPDFQDAPKKQCKRMPQQFGLSSLCNS